MPQYKNFSTIKINTTQSEQFVKPNCPICGDTGVVFDTNGQTHPCICWKNKQLKQKQVNANIPKALQTMTFDNFDLSYYPTNENPELGFVTDKSYLTYAKNAKKEAENFVHSVINKDNNIQGIMFQGQVGSGKTHLSAAIANSLLQNNQNVLFLVVPDFLDEIRMSYGNFGEFNENQLMKKAKNSNVLILDDLGNTNFSDWTKNKLFSLINYRVNNELPIIITTNLKIDELKDLLGERTISRIISVCKPCILPVKRDIRLTKIYK